MRSGSKPVCYQYRDSGFCSYGLNCRSSHNGDPGYEIHHPGGNKVSFIRDASSLNFNLVDKLIFSLNKKKKKQQPSFPPKPRQEVDAIPAFFAQYPDFTYNDRQAVTDEFYRMCDFFGWERNDVNRRQARQAFKDAMVHHFNSVYGSDVSDIENWHRLCLAVRIETLPLTIAECKEVCTSVTLSLSLI